MMNTTREMIDLSGRKIAAVLNTASGTCTPESKDEMLAILQEFNVTPAHVWCGSSEGLSVAFDEVKSIQANVLIVLGGDGTIRSAAEQCTGAGPLLIPLPGGTMNVLPKALYGEGSWQDILRKICANPTIKKVSGGEIQGHRFFISAICGAPSRSTKRWSMGRSLSIICSHQRSPTVLMK
jgi:diacylglycerol kinase family enzyme